MQPAELSSYTETCRNQGLTDQEITDRLLASGWSSEAIGAALRTSFEAVPVPLPSPPGHVVGKDGRPTVKVPSVLFTIVLWQVPVAAYAIYRYVAYTYHVGTTMDFLPADWSDHRRNLMIILFGLSYAALVIGFIESTVIANRLEKWTFELRSIRLAAALVTLGATIGLTVPPYEGGIFIWFVAVLPSIGIAAASLIVTVFHAILDQTGNVRIRRFSAFLAVWILLMAGSFWGTLFLAKVQQREGENVRRAEREAVDVRRDKVLTALYSTARSKLDSGNRNEARFACVRASALPSPTSIEYDHYADYKWCQDEVLPYAATYPPKLTILANGVFTNPIAAQLDETVRISWNATDLESCIVAGPNMNLSNGKPLDNSKSYGPSGELDLVIRDTERDTSASPWSYGGIAVKVACAAGKDNGFETHDFMFESPHDASFSQ